MPRNKHFGPLWVDENNVTQYRYRFPVEIFKYSLKIIWEVTNSILWTSVLKHWSLFTPKRRLFNVCFMNQKPFPNLYLKTKTPCRAFLMKRTTKIGIKQQQQAIKKELSHHCHPKPTLLTKWTTRSNSPIRWQMDSPVPPLERSSATLAFTSSDSGRITHAFNGVSASISRELEWACSASQTVSHALEQ